MDRNHKFATVVAALSLAAVSIPAAAAGPSNDERAGATVIGALPYSTTQDVGDATPAADDPPITDCYPYADDGGRTVWYRHTAEADARLVASVTGSTYPTAVQVLESSGSTERLVACGGSGWEFKYPPLTFDAVRGHTYTFLVAERPWDDDSWPPSSYVLRLNLHEQPDIDVTIDTAAFIDAHNGRVTVTGAAYCSRSTWVVPDLRMRQGTGRDTVRQMGHALLDCGPTRQLFSVRIPVATGWGDGSHMEPGRGTLQVYLRAPTEGFQSVSSFNVDLVECTQIGTVGSDVMRGSARRDRLCGLHGDDVMRAGGGDDVLFGGPGRDRLVGGSGSDRCYGGGGRDIFRGCEVRKQ
jgi:hypothetical protein